MIPPEFLLLYRIVRYPRFVFPYETEYYSFKICKELLEFLWALHWICRLLLVRRPLLIILLIHEHGRSFHLLISSVFSSNTWSSCHTGFSLAWLELHQDSLYYLWVLCKVVLPWSFLTHLLCVYRRTTNFFQLILNSSHCAASIYQL